MNTTGMTNIMNLVSLHGVVLQNRDNLYLYFGFFYVHAHLSR